VVNNGLVAIVKAKQEHPAHNGGRSSANTVTNGTTFNSSGSDDTVNDGKTFRSYAQGKSLIFHLDLVKSRTGYDFAKIQTFAGHFDGLTSQNYSVLIAATDLICASTRRVHSQPSLAKHHS
jgi:hypothetical protein